MYERLMAMIGCTEAVDGTISLTLTVELRLESAFTCDSLAYLCYSV